MGYLLQSASIALVDNRAEAAARQFRHGFRVIGNTPFLRILPSHGFTRDGVVALDHKQALRYRVIWGGRQDSATVLRQLLFWLRFLAEGHEEWTLETGGAPLRICVMPASTETEVGVASDHIQIKALVDESPEGELASVMDSAELGVSEEAEEPSHQARAERADVGGDVFEGLQSGHQTPR